MVCFPWQKKVASQFVSIRVFVSPPSHTAAEQSRACVRWNLVHRLLVLQAACRYRMGVCLRASKMPDTEITACQQYMNLYLCLAGDVSPCQGSNTWSHGSLFTTWTSLKTQCKDIYCGLWIFSVFFSLTALILIFLFFYISRTSARKGLCPITFLC